MFFLDARLRLKEVLQIARQRADALRGEAHVALEIVDDVARYAVGRVRERYMGESTDPVASILNAFIFEAADELIKGKKVTAVAIADEKRLAKQIEIEAQNAQEWEKRAMLAANANNDVLVHEAVARKREHMELVSAFRAQWERQKNLTDNLKTTLRQMNYVVENAKRMKNRLNTRRVVLRAKDLSNRAERMAQIVNGLELLTDFDQLMNPTKNQKPTNE